MKSRYGADEYTQPEDWEADEEMPVEAKEEDEGWLPGPAQRQLSPFLGPKPGPRDPTLGSNSSVTDFLDTQLSKEFIDKVVEYTHVHCEQWREQHLEWGTDAREKIFRKPRKSFSAAEFRLWLACRLRVAQLKPEIAAYALWDSSSSLFDVQVFSAMTYNQYQWVNRHVSFADIYSTQHDDDSDSEDSESSEASQEVDDCSDEDDQPSEEKAADDNQSPPRLPTPLAGEAHRKRRELTDLACKAFGKAWYPHQFLGADEAVRARTSMAVRCAFGTRRRCIAGTWWTA